jgi:MoxR-like ATPase
VFLALRLQRPLFLEGAPGVGKTALARGMAKVLDADLIRLQCYEGIDASQALLLEVLEEYSISIPQLGPISAPKPGPLVVLTSNQTREVHDALKRRCIYHWIDPPSRERELEIVQRANGGIPDAIATGVVELVRQLRSENLLKPPGIAESIDLAHAAHALGAVALDAGVVEAALGTVVKHQADRLRVRQLLDRIGWPVPAHAVS